MDEIGICLDRLNDLLGLGSRLELNVHHTAMDTRTCGDRHRERLAHPCDSLDSHGVPHTHPRAKVRIGNPLRYDRLHQGTYYRVTPGIPPRGDDRDRLVLASRLP